MSDFHTKLMESFEAGTFAATISELYHQGADSREMIAKEIAELHNSGDLDVVSEFGKLTYANCERDFFTARLVFGKSLALFEHPISDVATVVKHLTLEAGNDMAANMLIPEFIQFCEQSPNRPEQLLSIATENIDEDFDFITPAIVSGCKFDLHRYITAAIELSKHEDRKVCARAVHALGRATYGESISLANNALHAIETATTYLEPEVCYAAISATYALGKIDGIKKDDVEKIIQNILTIEHENILHAASLILMFEKDTISNSTAEILLLSLSNTRLENSTTIQNIDLAMDGLLKRGLVECVIDFLEMFLQRHSN